MNIEESRHDIDRARVLASILDERGPTEIDYVSLDVEGGETGMLSTFPFENLRIPAWTIENNARDNAVRKPMEAKRYRLVEAPGADGVYLNAGR